MKLLERQTILISLVAIIISSYSPFSFADFEDLGAGVRPMGMGSAFTGLVDDVHSIYYNPAGLSQITSKELTTAYGKLYWGLDDGSNLGNTFIGYAHPIGKAAGIGASWVSLGLGSLYREDTFIIAYGNRLSSSFFGGLNFKLLSKRYGKNSYTRTDPIFDGEKYSKIGFSGGLGLLYKLAPNIFSGLSIIDILQPNMNLEDKKDKLPLGIKAGFAYRDRIGLINLVLDATYRGGAFDISAGAEKWLSGRSLAARGGIEIGSDGFKSFSLGGSFWVSPFEIDYAFIYPLSGLAGSYGSHRFSFTFRFGRSREALAEIGRTKPIKKVYVEVPLSEEEKTKQMREYYYRGIEYYKNGQYEAAIVELEKVLELEPNHAQSIRLIERAREKLKIEK